MFFIRLEHLDHLYNSYSLGNLVILTN